MKLLLFKAVSAFLIWIGILSPAPDSTYGAPSQNLLHVSTSTITSKFANGIATTTIQAASSTFAGNVGILGNLTVFGSCTGCGSSVSGSGFSTTSADYWLTLNQGLAFSTTSARIAFSSSALGLTYTNTTGDTAHVEAWIDWNGDGDFDEAGEMVADWSDEVTSFPDRLEVAIPSNVVVGSLIGLRIRISNQDNMTPYGEQPNGEVEDYLIGIACPQVCLPIQATIIRQD